MSLPESGWKGYGRPGFVPAALRQTAIANDNAGHALREWAFDKWRAETIFPAAVNRWIAEIGVRTNPPRDAA